VDEHLDCGGRHDDSAVCRRSSPASHTPRARRISRGLLTPCSRPWSLLSWRVKLGWWRQVLISFPGRSGRWSHTVSTTSWRNGFPDFASLFRVSHMSLGHKCNYTSKDRLRICPSECHHSSANSNKHNLSHAVGRQHSMTMRIVPMLLTMLSLATATPASALSHRGWDQSGSIARDGLVAVAFGLPLVRGDWPGAEQAGLSLGGAFIVTEGLKHLIPERRPDGSDDRSFPSGHTSVRFAAAATLEKRYGWRVGVPAHVVAAFVGVSRVAAKKHYVGDVLVGAAIGEASGLLLSSPRDARVRWLPWGSAHGGGASVALRF
jgi:membrane-associated phospholipid phosphatase